EWADVSLPDLYTTTKCGCGCGTIAIDETEYPQNPKMAGRQGLVGGIDILTTDGGWINIHLFHHNVFLDVLEAVYMDQNGEWPPLPRQWHETSRVTRSAEEYD
ncbi:MAG: hypothetical protein ACREP9_21240, partial [Candidatus Dormibacteraceae bacterium]